MNLLNLEGANSNIISKLKKLNIKNSLELINHFPKRYEDRRICKKLIELINLENENYPVEIKIIKHTYFKTKNGPVLKIIVSDGSNNANLICFNRDHLKKMLIEGETYIIFGKFQYQYGEIQTHSFEFTEKDKAINSLNFLRIVPIYPLTEGIKQQTLRNLIYQVISNKIFNDNINQIQNTKEEETLIKFLEEKIPKSIIKKRQLISIKKAFQEIHFPKDTKTLSKANYRLKYSELFNLEINVALKRSMHSKQESRKYIKNHTLANKIIQTLPFKLTQEQNKVIQEINDDLQSTKPMHRMLQGEVGSGKTIVALISMMQVIESGYQCALMCPLEILARQHHNNFSKILENFPIKTVLLTSQISQKKKKELHYLINQGFYKIIIGTQSIFNKNLEYKKLGLVVIDEQHKFGVEDRIKLGQKGITPDVLLMTATPIPRTLSLTIYGDLEMSLIKEKPKNTSKVKSYIIIGQDKRDKMYKFIDEKLDKGTQAFVVCPLIEESKNKDIKSAEKLFEELKEKLPDKSIALLHSKIKNDEKIKIMEDFLNKKYNMLISTSIIEVGIDIKNASIIVIENAERFGLPQLHQLRGRVGRGETESFCFFSTNEHLTENSITRLKALKENNDGFILAETDLKLRGPGEFLGKKQSGSNNLKLTNFYEDEKIIKEAKNDAFDILDKDPNLNKKENQYIKEHILQEFKDTHQFYLRS